MTLVHGFPPISRPDARVLILGSVPSVESLAQQRYYAHARNGFWPILTALLKIDDSAYPDRILQVQRRGIAIWDVLQACFRAGSLDSAIDEGSVVTNDFQAFFDEHPRVRRVYFNGARAESIYRRHVLPTLSCPAATLPLQRLPSTSPAHAGMTLEQKKAAWRTIMDD